MAIEEEIKEMRKRGLPDKSIALQLQARGLNQDEISQAMAQKQAPEYMSSIEEGRTANTAGMQQSMLPPEKIDVPNPDENNDYPQYTPQNPYESQQYSQPGVQEYEPRYQPEGYEEYQPYQSYSGASPDIISEISEQIISEKLSTIRKNLEKAIDLKNTYGTKIDYIEERLKRIEKIIDNLQSSVLRKVGDYVNNVEDIKKEIIETEKTLSKVIPGMKKTNHKKKK